MNLLRTSRTTTGPRIIWPPAGPAVPAVRAVPAVLALLAVLLAWGVAPSPAAAAPAAQPASAATTRVAEGSTPRHGVWPLQPRPPVVAGFEPPSTPWGRGHRGVDLAGLVGQQVHAAAAGVVTYAGRLAGRGVVVVDHGATRTTYEPVAASVQVGDPVPAGAVIGRLELFGSHCFPQACLHWGLIEGRDHYLDPLSLVGALPVRLLPLLGTSSAPLLPAVTLSRWALPLTPWPQLGSLPSSAAPPGPVPPRPALSTG